MKGRLTKGLGLAALAAVALVIGYDLATSRRSLKIHIHQRVMDDDSYLVYACMTNAGMTRLSQDDMEVVPQVVYETEQALFGSCRSRPGRPCELTFPEDADRLYMGRLPVLPYTKRCHSVAMPRDVERPVILGQFDDRTPLPVRWQPPWLINLSVWAPVHALLALLAVPLFLGALVLRWMLRPYLVGKKSFRRMERVEPPATGSGGSPILRRLQDADTARKLSEYMDIWPDALVGNQRRELKRIYSDGTVSDAQRRVAVDRIREEMSQGFERLARLQWLMWIWLVAVILATFYVPIRYLLAVL